MTTPGRFLHTFSTRRIFVLLALTLLLVNGRAVNAQGSANASATPNATANATPKATPNATPSASPNATPNTTPTPNQAGQADPTKSGWFFAVVSILFGAVVITFVGVIARAILFSKGTYSSPLGLPEGSLRAVLAFMLVAFLGLYVYAGVLIVPTEYKAPEFLLGIVATVIGFYFGSRSGEGTGAQTTGVIQGIVKDNAGAPAVGAVVELTQSNGKKLTQKADASGKYKFDRLAAGDYNLQAQPSQAGQQPSDVAKVTLTTGATQTVDLALK
jgi:hypothetical protein